MTTRTRAEEKVRRANEFLEAPVVDRTQDLMDREARLRAIIGNAVDVIIESFGPAAERILGRTADEVEGSNVGMLVPNRSINRSGAYVR
jgi:PAS domain-containing protein